MVRVAERRVSLAVTVPAWRSEVAAWFPAQSGLPAGLGAKVEHTVRLTGSPRDWRLWLDRAPQAQGTTREAALLALLAVLLRLGTRPAERLLVVHGAGLVAPDGRGLLLVAPGGSGKSTLAAALETAGFGLLGDDLVPVTLDGALLGLGLPLGLKAGSWPVLAGCRPEIADAPVIRRDDEPVRFLPPRTPTAGPVRPALLLLTRYRPGQAVRTEPLTPEQALHGLVEAEAVFRDLTQAKLTALARWLEGLPAWRLSYPDLASGQAAVRARLARDRSE